MLELATTKEAQDEIAAGLHEYITALKPVADYLHLAGSYSLQSYDVIRQEEHVIRALTETQRRSLPSTFANKVAGSLIAAMNTRQDSHDLWTACAALHPKFAVEVGDAYMPSARNMSGWLRTFIDEDEWRAYVHLAAQYDCGNANYEAHPEMWWQANAETLGSMVGVASFYLRIPTVVLGCDGQFSLAKRKFTSHQRNLNAEFASEILAAAANGDPSGLWTAGRYEWGK